MGQNSKPASVECAPLVMSSESSSSILWTTLVHASPPLLLVTITPLNACSGPARTMRCKCSVPTKWVARTWIKYGWNPFASSAVLYVSEYSLQTSTAGVVWIEVILGPCHFSPDSQGALSSVLWLMAKREKPLHSLIAGAIAGWNPHRVVVDPHY